MCLRLCDKRCYEAWHGPLGADKPQLHPGGPKAAPSIGTGLPWGRTLGFRICDRHSRLRGGAVGFLGFEFRRVRSNRGRWMPLLLPKGKKRTALLGKRKEIFRASRSQPVGG